MELRAFWSVISRWRWVVIVVSAAALLVGLASALISPPGYKAQSTVSFSAPLPASNVTLPGLDTQNRSIYSEAVVEDFTKIVQGRTFADAVAKRLPAALAMDPRIIQKAYVTKKQAHHLLQIEASAPTEAGAVALSQVAIEEILQNGQAYYKALNTPELSVSIIDPGVTEGLSGRLVDIILLAARVVVGLVVAVGLAFLLNYLDVRVHTSEEVEALGVHIIGEIPVFSPGTSSSMAVPGRVGQAVPAAGSSKG